MPRAGSAFWYITRLTPASREAQNGHPPSPKRLQHDPGRCLVYGPHR